MYRIRFSIAISEQQFLEYYRGHAKAVSVLADDGRRVEFPASCLRPYVTRAGVSGRFELYFTAAGKFVKLQPVPAGRED